jgi:surface antigen
MRTRNAGIKACLLGSALILGSSHFTARADAGHANDYAWSTPVGHVSIKFAGDNQAGRPGHGMRQVANETRGADKAYGISCVPYAREASGILVAGNAWQWWGNAAGEYARGFRPEPDSVLTFRGNSRMRLGHVAVVRKVVNAREIIVDHANWPGAGMRGGVSRNVAIVDVSEANNWSAVRVQLSRAGEFGSVYPTYGFIYKRPDNGIMIAKIDRPAPQPAINRTPADLRPVAERPWRTIEEVAESPTNQPHRMSVIRVDQATGNH